MSGSIKVGGNTIATHTGAQGAGEVTLGTNIRLSASGGIQDSSGNNVLTESGGDVTISNSAIKLKSSGNSITKSDGTTAVLSESAGVVTLTTNTILEAVTDAGVSIEDVTIVGNKTVGARDDVTIEILQAGNYILTSSGVSDQLNLGDQLAIANGSNHTITSIGWTHPVNKRISKIELWGYWPTVTSFQAGIVRNFGSTNQGASFFASESKTRTNNDYMYFDISSYSISRSDYYYAVRITVTNTSGGYVYYRGIRLTYVNF